MLVMRDSSDTLLQLASIVNNIGVLRDSRNGGCKEVLSNTFTITYPHYRHLCVLGRKNNPFAAVAETLWVLSGRDDVAFIEHYLPRARQFSDDGDTWRGGYGTRLRGAVDQIWECYKLLKETPDTRRAAINIYDGTKDFCDSKDIPCNNWLNFQLRDGKLHMNVAVRSNDLIWGCSGINMFEWSVLQHMLAEWLGVEVGTQTWLQGSLHVYERHFDMLDSLQEVPHTDTDRPLGITEELYQDRLRPVMDYLTALHEGSSPDMPEEVVEGTWLWVYLNDLKQYWVWKHANTLPALVDSDDSWEISKGLFYRQFSPKRYYLQDLIHLHNEKGILYGNSWCKMGECFSILANILRKSDRLENIAVKGITASCDENVEDTVLDLLVYLAKYFTWLPDETSHPEDANKVLADLEHEDCGGVSDFRASALELCKMIETYASSVMNHETMNTRDKTRQVWQMIKKTWSLVGYLKGWV